MSVTTEVEQIVRELAPEVKSLEPDADLLAAGLIDSLMIVQLISDLEECFDIRVDDEDLAQENFRSVQSIARFVEAKGGGR